MFIIKFLLFIFLFIVVSVAITMGKVAWHIWKMHRQIKKQYSQAGASGRYQPQGTTYTQNADGEIITDTRDPQKANRKIIPDDEGEYVDFEEVK